MERGRSTSRSRARQASVISPPAVRTRTYTFAGGPGGVTLTAQTANGSVTIPLTYSDGTYSGTADLGLQNCELDNGTVSVANGLRTTQTVSLNATNAVAQGGRWTANAGRQGRGERRAGCRGRGSVPYQRGYLRSRIVTMRSLRMKTRLVRKSATVLVTLGLAAGVLGVGWSGSAGAGAPARSRPRQPPHRRPAPAWSWSWRSPSRSGRGR